MQWALHTIGPILAPDHTIIAVDIWGMGQSTISYTGDYTASADPRDLKGVVMLFTINQTYIVTYHEAMKRQPHSTSKSPIYQMSCLLGICGPSFGYEKTLSLVEIGVTEF